MAAAPACELRYALFQPGHVLIAARRRALRSSLHDGEREHGCSKGKACSFGHPDKPLHPQMEAMSMPRDTTSASSFRHVTHFRDLQGRTAARGPLKRTGKRPA